MLKIKNIVLLLLVINIYTFAQVDYNIEIPSIVNTVSKSKSTTTYSKSMASKVSIGNYVWFDHNQNGIQDLGELGVYGVELKLYDNASCSGTAIANTKTSDIGYYIFSDITSSSNKYCIGVIYPKYWTHTLAYKGKSELDSNLVEMSNSMGKIENISLIKSDNTLDVGLRHKAKDCQIPSLTIGTEGVYDKGSAWAKRYALNVEFKNVVAGAFCHEYRDSGPVEGERFSVHLKDRRGFSIQQRDYLSRMFGFMSDSEVITFIDDTFDSDIHFWFNIVSNSFVWYYSDWKQDFGKIEDYIDESSWSDRLTIAQKDALKSLSRLIIDKIEGKNGEVQYAPIKVYYLWNETTDRHQDLIVPETLVIPKQIECKVDAVVISTAKCYAMTDNAKKVYEVYMSPNGNPLPTPRTIDIPKVFIGEGSAYRGSNHTLYAFQVEGDDKGPSDLYAIDLTNGKTILVVDNIISGSTDAAEFYNDPKTNSEILYIISGEYSSKLYAFYADSWKAVDGYPKNISGDNKNLSSLAIDPNSGNAYAIDDYNYDKKKPKIYKIDLLTGRTTFIIETKSIVDAEGLSYAADGNLYLEDERELDGRKLYKVNLITGELTAAANLEGTSGDFESISCNGTKIVLDAPKIEIETATNGVDADEPTGPSVAFGGEIKWSYLITNSGNVMLTNLVVTDDKVGNICTVASLAIGESKTCTKVGSATAGQYMNIGKVVAEYGTDVVSAEDKTHYMGGIEALPAIKIETATNGIDADNPTGPTVEFDSEVVWTYLVTNRGNVTLTDIVVTDSKIGNGCSVAKLYAGATKTCTKTGKAIEGQYANVGTVRAKYGDIDVDDSDMSHYLGKENPMPKVDIETATNGIDADNRTGPALAFDALISWTYVIKNMGNVELTNIKVTDSQVGNICMVASLAVGASKTCTKTATAITGQYENEGKVIAAYGTVMVDDADKTHYIGGEEPIVLPPVSMNDRVLGETGEAVTLKTLDNDSSVGSILDPATVKLTHSDSTNDGKRLLVDGEGIWSVNPITGEITFTPESGFTNDPTAVNYTVEDEKGQLSNPSKEEVDYPQTEPTARDDGKIGKRCKPVVLDIVKNDSDPENDLDVTTVDFVIPDGATGSDSDNDGDIDTVVVPSEGIWSVSSEGKVTYTPNEECTGSPTPLSYRVLDRTKKESNIATIKVTYPEAEKAELGNRVWFDADKNGKQDDGEPGLKDVTVELYDANGELNGTTLTDENGIYSFVNLDAGEYKVKFVAKDGWSVTIQNLTDVEEDIDSDADKVTGETETIILNEGNKNLDVDVGMYHTPQPSIEIIKTTNGGNVGNIVVGDTITWTYVVSNTGNAPLSNIVIKDSKEGAVTDCTGEGSLDTLNPTQSITCTKVGTAILGTYTNDVNVTADTDENNITASDSSSYVGKETLVETGSIGDFVWLDNDKNGLQEESELPLSGIIVKLFDSSNKEIATTSTDALGKYIFTDIVAGDYYVKFTIPSGYTVTAKDKGDEEQDSDTDSNGKTATFTLTVGEDKNDIDMGLYPMLVDLGNRVWYDGNQNGLQDPEEKDQSIANITVKLYKEGGEFIKETKTRVSGYYGFKGLMAGNYYVMFDVPENYKVSPQNIGSNESDDSDANPQTGKTDIITLIAGINNRMVDIGLYQEAAKVGDRVWYDANKNGVQDAGENGVGDVTVELYRVGEVDAVAVTKTTETGIYLFDNVAPADYYILFTAPVAYTISEANRGDDSKDSDADTSGRTESFTLLSGTQNSTIDMGIYQNVVSLGDKVWLDTNHDGLQDVGEIGVRDVNVTVHSETNDFSKSVLTDENGNYLFTHLSAGEYSVEFNNVPYGHLVTQKDVNNNESDLNDSDVFVNADEKLVTEGTLLTPGENDLSWDMGVYKTVCLPGKAVLGNLVWEDFNKNGIQDIGERGVANVKVTLFNNDTDEKVTEVSTDENGLYEFAHLDPEFNYYVQFTVPAGYVVSPQDQDDEIIDSDADASGRTDVISLTADQINSTVDMGIHHEGSTIGDRVWYDEKDGVSNGVQEEGENGVQDVKVTLYSSSGEEVKTTQTNASGEYHFTNISKGNYSIGFSELPDGYIFAIKDQGANEEADSDANTHGRTEIITINGIHNLTHIDAGIKTVRSGNSGSDIKRGVSGKDVTIDVLSNDNEGTYAFDATTVKITSTPDGATLSEDGKTLTVPNEGVWSVDPITGAITFTPNDGFVGDPTAISYSVSDTQGNETGADVEVNYPPVAQDDYVNGEVGKQIIIYVTDNDTNTSSPLDKASVRIIDPSNGDEVETLTVEGQGTWSTNTNGSITFTPEDGFENNPIPIEYTVKEQSGDVSNRAIVTIVYPDAVDDMIIVPIGHTGDITVNVIENDSNNTDASLISIGCTPAEVKSLTVNGEGVWNVHDNGTIIFTPEAEFVAEPTDINYSVGLVQGGYSNCATVDVRYELLARDDSSLMNVGRVTLIHILSNDYGSLNPESVILILPSTLPAGSRVTADGKSLTTRGEGVWTVNSEGLVTFIAEDGFTSTPTPINYTVENNNGTVSNVAIITLTQGGVSIIATDNSGVAEGASPITINVLADDSGDLNGAMVYLLDSNGSLVQTFVVEGEGTWRVNSDQTVTFTPVSGYTGTPRPIDYLIQDRNGLTSNDATITITGICTCDPYETSVSVMSDTAAILMFLLTLLLTLFFFEREERLRV